MNKPSEWNWSLVRPFLAALDQGSLLGAAKVLSSTQPTVGRQIAELERQWGVVLFERHGRGLTPTTMALQLADVARRPTSLRAWPRVLPTTACKAPCA